MIGSWLRRHRALWAARWPWREFWQEWRAVRAGSRKLEKGDPDAAIYRLRRNLHRLEKGLAMPDRRTVFATGYIAETVTAYAAAREAAGETDELRAAHALLRAYFEQAGSHPAIDAARRAFEAISPPTLSLSTAEVQPARQKELGPPPLTYEKLMDVFRHRRAVRWFLPKPVPREFLDRAVAAALAAPSACNRQALTFLFVVERRGIEAIARLLLGVEGMDPQIPVLGILIGDLRAYEHPRDRHLIYVDGGLAAAYFMLALDALGLASCPINWPDRSRENEQLAKLLDLAPDQRPVLCFAIGWPDPNGTILRSPRKSISEMRRYL